MFKAGRTSLYHKRQHSLGSAEPNATLIHIETNSKRDVIDKRHTTCRPVRFNSCTQQFTSEMKLQSGGFDKVPSVPPDPPPPRA
jgi:hypothetical protein